MRKRLGLKLRIALGLSFILLVYVIWCFVRPLPLIRPTNTIRVNLDTPPAQLDWPGSTEAAVGILGDNSIETSGSGRSLPTASTAKLITALVVLKAKPLSLNQAGPSITFGPSDVSLYNTYVSEQGSVVPVVNGEQMSEYQALEAMLLPSANNVADSLAIWAYGSLSAYRTAATSYVKSIGLTSTFIGTDASGFAPSTTSSAGDLVKLGEIVMNNPLLSHIVSESTVSGIPVVNTIKNVNYLLGTDGIIGIKTGNSNQAGGVFVAADRLSVDEHPVTVVTAVVGETDLNTAMSTSLSLLKSAYTNFASTKVLPANATIGYYRVPGGPQIPIVTTSDLIMTTWQGEALIGQASVPKIPYNTPLNKPISELVVKDMTTGIEKSVSLELGAKPSQPALWYRLVHP